MPRLVKPYFKASHNAWYVNLEGKQVRLAATEADAIERYGEILQERKKAARFSVPNAPAVYTLGCLAAEFFDSAFKDKAERTKVFYARLILPLVSHIGKDFPATELKPFHVERWTATHPRWKKGMLRAVWRSVQRLMWWGERSGRTPHSSVCDYKKPSGGRRTTIITPFEFATSILPNLRSQHFRDLVIVAWESGARPQELLAIESRHYDPRSKRIVFPQEEAKVDTHPRIVYLTEEAAAIVERLIALHPQGRIFRNQSGRPWTTSSVNCEWLRLRHRLAYPRDEAAKHRAVRRRDRRQATHPQA